MKRMLHFRILAVLLLVSSISFGQNLITVNSGFEDGDLTGWSSWYKNGTTGTVEVSTDNPYEGNYCLKVTADAMGEGLKSIPMVNMDKAVSTFNLVAGKTYKYSYMLKVVEAGSEVTIRLFPGGVFNDFAKTWHNGKVTDWIAVEKEFVCPEDPVYENCILQLNIIGAENAQSVFYFDNINIAEVVTEEPDVPDVPDEPVVETQEIDRSNWKLVDSNNELEPASNAIDGNIYSNWSTPWKEGETLPHPHYITIDMGAPYEITELNYTPRQDQWGYNGTIVKYRVAIGNSLADMNNDASWFAPLYEEQNIVSGTLNEADFTYHDVDFDGTVKQVLDPMTIKLEHALQGRYLRLYVDSTLNGKEETVIAEISANGKALVPAENMLNREGWNIAYADTFLNAPEGAIDGDLGSSWSTPWDPPVELPHEIIIDMGTSATVDSLLYFARQDVWGINGTLKDYEIYVSDDMNDMGAAITGSTDYEGTYQPATPYDTLVMHKKPMMIKLPTAPTGRYLKIKFISNLNPDNDEAIINELYAYGTYHYTSENSLDRSGWTVLDANVEQNPASNAIDNDPSTMWTTPWKEGETSPHPHFVTIDMGGFYEISELIYLPRQDQWGYNGTIINYRVAVGSNLDDMNNDAAWFISNYEDQNMVSGSIDSASQFTYHEVDFDGTVKQVLNPINLKLDKTLRGRYLRLYVDSTLAGKDETTVAELYAIGKKLVPTEGALAKDTWSVVAADTAFNSPDLAIDSDFGTGWNTPWDPPAPLPHEITFDLGGEASITSLMYVGRQDVWGPNGTLTDYEIYVSNDANNFGNPKKIGKIDWSSMFNPVTHYDSISYYKIPVMIELPDTAVGRYVKVVFNGSIGDVEATIYELFAYGAYTNPPATNETAPITFIVDDSAMKTATGFGLKGSWLTATGEYDSDWNGGDEHAKFFDDGTHGDVTAGDNIWTVTLDLVVDGGTNEWEWGVNDSEGSWLDGNFKFNVADTSAQTLTFVIKDTGVDDFTLSGSVYPNPVLNRLNIAIAGEIQAVSIINVSGQEVMKSASKEPSIDVSSLEKGLYLIKVTDTNNAVLVQRFQKN